MTDAPASLDVVIPTLNEAEGILPMLTSLDVAVKSLKEMVSTVTVTIVAVDGGSTDATLELVAGQGITCLESSKKGRGNQIAHGINELSGEWILILHGDCRVKPDALCELYKNLSEDESFGWGILGHDYDRGGVLLWLTRLINRWRFDSKGLGYGDQGQFVKRCILSEKGGFPEIPLMEDVELSLMLEDVPRFRLGEWLTASSRQWQKKGFWRYSIQNIRFARRYTNERRRGRSALELAQELYTKYYGV